MIENNNTSPKSTENMKQNYKARQQTMISKIITAIIHIFSQYTFFQEGGIILSEINQNLKFYKKNDNDNNSITCSYYGFSFFVFFFLFFCFFKHCVCVAVQTEKGRIYFIFFVALFVL